MSPRPSIHFFIRGVKPITQGSKTGFPFRKKDGSLGVRMTSPNDKALKDWRYLVHMAAVHELHEHYEDDSLKIQEEFPYLGPVRMELVFTLQRPKGHFGTGRNKDKLKPSAPRFHTQKPDLFKLARAVEDALTGLIYRDDSQIIQTKVTKQWGRQYHTVVNIYFPDEVE